MVQTKALETSCILGQPGLQCKTLIQTTNKQSIVDVGLYWWVILTVLVLRQEDFRNWRPARQYSKSHLQTILKMSISHVWWHTPIILALGRLRQKDAHLEASLGYVVGAIHFKMQDRIFC